MGSVAQGEDEQQPITVLLTGFAPFKKDYPVNPSWEIVRGLPDWLPPLRAKTVTSTPVAPAPAPGLTTPPRSPSPRSGCSSTRSRSASTTRSSSNRSNGDSSASARRRTASPPPPKIDLAIHVGMAGPRAYYSIERRGHRDGYVMPDVDGRFLREDDERRARRGEAWVWEGVPAELETALDLGDVLSRWRGWAPKHADLRISEDAGHYLCDFIYFSSLAHLYKAGEPRKVLFLHVPSDASENSVALGRELLLQLVRSVVESEVARRAEGKAEET
ncbi:7f6dfdf9-3e87-42ff-86fd-b96b084d773a [Thermothielavioides terrestris]|uniref:7f6dfdf9-3e87-42ff-86fd-b96b084d773a n=1 Tax=Thermothielavioides terrestris TaxID=2587410 RepID=A0A446B802_9PEZI|nr:7f6dfdf9-3e87-42ff-86fd-b96b084d773a [Thermothielavioides terrestris]